MKLLPPNMLADSGQVMAKSLNEVPVPQGDDGRYDYSHLLPDELKQKGYRIRIDDGVDPDGTVMIEAHIKQHDPEFGTGDDAGPGHYCGIMLGKMGHNRKLGIHLSHVYKGHRDQGLGGVLYEAFLAHAHNKLGATHVAGGVHSTLSHAVHKKVAAKHGLSYEAHRTGERVDPPPNDDVGSFDDAFDGYEYKLR